MRTDDLNYFRARAVQEQVAAQKADCEQARKRHEELAAMYRFRAAMLSSPVTDWCGALTGDQPLEIQVQPR